jgi:hypothetical protein
MLMKTLAMLLMLATLLTSCRSGLEHETEQCSPYFVYVDGGGIDPQASVCFCRNYKFSRDYVGPIAGTDNDKPISYCHKMVGFPKYTETATFWEKVRRAITRQENFTLENQD